MPIYEGCLELTWTNKPLGQGTAIVRMRAESLPRRGWRYQVGPRGSMARSVFVTDPCVPRAEGLAGFEVQPAAETSRTSRNHENEQAVLVEERFGHEVVAISAEVLHNHVGLRDGVRDQRGLVDLVQQGAETFSGRLLDVRLSPHDSYALDLPHGG